MIAIAATTATAGAVQPGTQATEGFSSAITFDGKGAPHVSSGATVSRVTSPSGKALASRAATPARFEPQARASANYACINNRSRRGFVKYAPHARSSSTKALYIRFVYSLYKQNNARRVDRYGTNIKFRTKQYELCTVGGAHALGGNKLRRVVTGTTMASRHDRLRGQKWGTGTKKSTAKASLGFAVARDPVTISGSVEVHPEDTISGSQGPDKQAPSLFRPSVVNQVNATWEKGGLPSRFNGSTHFQGNVGHALWELPMRQTKVPPIYNFAQSQRRCGKVAYGCE